MNSVYAIYNEADRCIYLCYSYVDEEYEYYEQAEEMNDWDWEVWLDETKSSSSASSTR